MPRGCLITCAPELEHVKHFLHAKSFNQRIAGEVASRRSACTIWLFFLISGIRRDDGAGLVQGTPEWFHKTTSGQMSTGTVTGFAVAAGWLRFMCAPTVLIAPRQCSHLARGRGCTASIR